jgi:DNA-binding XRE family transcriptional regulator
MNIGKSTKIYLAKQEKTKAELGKHLGVSRPTLTKILDTKTGGSVYLQETCQFFSIEVSEFIKAGE